MTSPLQRTPVFSRFFAQIASSWLIGPIGVLFLQWYGWGSQPILIAVLLALSLAAPIQLLSNEYLAAGVIARAFAISRLQLLALLGATLVAVVSALHLSNGVNSHEPFGCAYLVVGGLTIGSIWLSYRTCLIYYNLVANHRSGPWLSVVVGSVPGLTNLACFALAAVSNRPWLLMLAAIFPAILQLAVLASMTRNSSIVVAKVNGSKDLPGLRSGNIAGLAAALIAVGMASTILRDFLAAIRPQFAALVLVALNLMGTLVLAFGRATYLSAGRPAKMLPLVGLCLSLLVAAAFVAWSPSVSAFMTLLALQFLVAVILAMALRDPSESPS